MAGLISDVCRGQVTGEMHKRKSAESISNVCHEHRMGKFLHGDVYNGDGVVASSRRT